MTRRAKIVSGSVIAAVALAGVFLLRSRAIAPNAKYTYARAGANGSSATVAGSANAVPTGTAMLSPRGTKTVRVTADRTITAAERRVLTDLEARVIAPVGARAVLVEVTPDVATRIAKDVRFTTEDVLPESKIQDTLAGLCKAQPEATLPIAVVGLAAEDRATISNWVVAQGGTLRTGMSVPEILYADVPSALVASLADRGDVRWIEYDPPARLLNDHSVVAAAANVDSVRSTHLLRGHGQTVAIYDSGFDTGNKDNCHLDFAGRVKAAVKEAYTAADYVGHGTHCAGTILGDGTRSDGLYKGLAPEAMLYAQGAGDTEGSSAIYLPGTPEHIFASGTKYDAYIQSNSWGSDSAGEYTTKCASLDQVAWNHPDLLLVVACGNAGKGGMSTVGSPAAAKNALTVGNGYSTRGGDNPEDLNLSSSRGPTKDNRIKPEIAAPGTRIYSARSSFSALETISGNKYYTEMTGTSMATPLVAGSAALVRQWLQDRRDYGDALPTAALLKAILTGGGTGMSGCCGAEAIPATLPNNYIGWGRLNLAETIYPTNGTAVTFRDRVPFHDGVTETIDIKTTAAAPLDVQLCWTDYPADASAAKTLVNDLDLIVSNKTTGAVWYGNDLTDGDRVNTTESVRIPLAAAGDYAVLVKGAAVAYSSDEGGAAAVYVRGAFPDVTKPDPVYIRNPRTGIGYEFLASALKDVQDGDTLEINSPVTLEKSVTLSVSCTLTTTGADALASLVTRENGATITVKNGASLTLKNLVFAKNPSQPALTVAAGSKLKLSDKVGFGTVSAGGADCIELVGRITSVADGVNVDCPAAYDNGERFGSYTCSYADAQASAGLINNVRDTELGGSAVDGTGALVWGVIPVTPENACAFVNVNGTSTPFRSFKRAIEAAAAGDATITVTKNASFNGAATLSHKLNLVSEGDATLTLGANAVFVIPASTQMELSDITICSTGASSEDIAFKVTGGSLTLDNGAVLSGISDRYNLQKAYGGAIAVFQGRVTMKSGSRIENCVSHSRGGAIWLNGSGSSADLQGGTIDGCTAKNSMGGGAVYACSAATVNIKGDFTATSNLAGSGAKAILSNLFLTRDTSFNLTGELTGAVGVSFGTKSGLSNLNLEQANFITAAAGITDVQKKNSAARIINDGDAELYGGVSAAGAIVWTKTIDDGQCKPADARYVVRIGNETQDRYYQNFADIFDLIDADMTIRLRSHETIVKSVTIRHAVRLEAAAGATTPGIWRGNDAMINVSAGGHLIIGNITVSGVEKSDDLILNTSEAGLIAVNGGALTLESGATVGPVFGSASRAANAITVWNGGTVTMNSGALITGSCNSFYDPANLAGCGGGILLEHATAFFKGGTIRQCQAARAGAVYVSNGSAAYVSGDFTAADNLDRNNLGNNIVVSKNSQLVLDGALTGSIGMNEGISCDTNRFATVDSNWKWDVTTLKSSAKRFFHDFTRKTGLPVASGESTVLVWSDWVTRAGAYKDADGTLYRMVLDPGRSVVAPKAFSVGASAMDNGRVALALDGGVEGCWYTIYAADSLTGPFKPVKSVQLGSDQDFRFEIDTDKESRFYKVIAEEGIR